MSRRPRPEPKPDNIQFEIATLMALGFVLRRLVAKGVIAADELTAEFDDLQTAAEQAGQTRISHVLVRLKYEVAAPEFRAAREALARLLQQPPADSA